MAGVQAREVADIKAEVSERLKAEGGLGQIRAQIRATVYTALLTGEGGGPVPECMRSAPRLLVSLVADLLKQAELDNTLAVFNRESEQRIADRPSLQKELASSLEGSLLDKASGDSDAMPDGPVLAQVLEAARLRSRSSTGGAPAAAGAFEGLEAVIEEPRGTDGTDGQ
eukprot:CAMPEP_0176058034 /NCGR_PEP_ID=MMETSP0120_2-20121206/28910_1 /TAXON_ID=160619 /ORGANISM="Kryptoperidinium foliaceum, Strain CCMP 1326" /LENGTH=168 /DNA_ID=CAMNT_0017391553 /DNA_START=24 /DNA_END=530 /DNA_ORIENTATION=+